VQGYRDPNTGKVKHKTVKSLGYLDELEKEFKDPIAHFKEVAKQMTNRCPKARMATTAIIFNMLLKPNIVAIWLIMDAITEVARPSARSLE